MKLNTLTKLNIEDKLYRYDFFKNGIFEYKVIGIREYPEGIFYEVECKNCTDHPNCRLLINKADDDKYYKYVAMTNEDEDNKQYHPYYWHSDGHYHTSVSDCKKEAYRKILDNKLKRKEDLKKALSEINRQIEELKLLMDNKIIIDWQN